MTIIEHIRNKIDAQQPITENEGLWLYENASLPQLQALASIMRQRLNGSNVYFNRNIHIEPTNLCANKCLFCAFARHAEHDDGAFTLSLEQIKSMAGRYKNKGITEVHITGGVHPQWRARDYAAVVAAVRKTLPVVHIKAFTAEEVWKMHSKSHLSVSFTLLLLYKAGMRSLAGGGAEILNDEVRKKICPTKTSVREWLGVHTTAHGMGIKSNATMLYGHIENYAHRIEHLSKIRSLQEKTHGFNAFIPLKYSAQNNNMPATIPLSMDDDSRNMAVCRIFLHNIVHLKAYLPALGIAAAESMLHSGADDMDGTIYDGTKIYAHDGNAAPAGIDTAELQTLCSEHGYTLCERDSEYKIIARKR
jgi:aminodeoxyfutalosine synthase